jgi:hypothetical protein
MRFSLAQHMPGIRLTRRRRSLRIVIEQLQARTPISTPKMTFV